MPAHSSFDYALIRVMPRVERGEMLNAGVILFCLEKDFLEARVEVDEERLRALWPEIDLDLVRQHLEAIPKICAGAPDAGPIGRWLVAPRSTMIQVSPVHAGLCDHPEQAIDRLFEQAVRLP
jgi:hypothetical protein